ncbi:hypothetical protein SELMODRAFT_416496 [Selaginella moellendorffii]|uniref:Uncharacterized protein n=1 Tax=Selaginella moellendorffii TaxID=88036 RepID=D8RZG5_SELML|nr:hypothetical protein SELMODRAFT_416496 [Selaginella moellendorffii]
MAVVAAALRAVGGWAGAASEHHVEGDGIELLGANHLSRRCQNSFRVRVYTEKQTRAQQSHEPDQVANHQGEKWIIGMHPSFQSGHHSHQVQLPGVREMPTNIKRLNST